MKNRVFTALAAVLLAPLLAGSAHARPAWMQEGKSGRFMVNLELGPSFDAKDTGLQGAIVPQMGIAVDHDFNAYILLPVPEFQVASGFSIVMIPVGFQYDIPIKPVPGLYISPAATVGYAALISSYDCVGCTVNSNTASAGFFAPEVGAKFIFQRRFNVGFVPFSLPIFFGSNRTVFVNNSGMVVNNGGAFAAVSYRVLFYGGINF